MKKPTEKQKKAILIKKDNRNISLGEAMRKAGYAPSTSRSPKQNFLDLKGTAVAMEQWRETLRGSGLDEGWLLKKYKEWGEATKIKSSITEPDKVVPDYETQLKVKDDIRGDLGLPTKEMPSVLQRFDVGGEMTLEFIGPSGKKSLDKSFYW